MNSITLLTLLNATQFPRDHLFIPVSWNAQELQLQVPGLLVNKPQTFNVLPTQGSLNQRGQLAPTNISRGLVQLEPRAQSRSPLAGESSDNILAFQNGNNLRVAVPICLACTCKVGFTSCAAANGILFFPATTLLRAPPVAVLNCPSSQPCVVVAPPGTSACDPACRLITPTCNVNIGASDINCNQPVAPAVCQTSCEYRLPGDKVVCDQRAIATGVMNNVPATVCPVLGGLRKRRSSR